VRKGARTGRGLPDVQRKHDAAGEQRGAPTAGGRRPPRGVKRYTGRWAAAALGEPPSPLRLPFQLTHWNHAALPVYPPAAAAAAAAVAVAVEAGGAGTPGRPHRGARATMRGRAFTGRTGAATCRDHRSGDAPPYRRTSRCMHTSRTPPSWRPGTPPGTDACRLGRVVAPHEGHELQHGGGEECWREGGGGVEACRPSAAAAAAAHPQQQRAQAPFAQLLCRRRAWWWKASPRTRMGALCARSATRKLRARSSTVGR
jgi:hypothetical protein